MRHLKVFVVIWILIGALASAESATADSVVCSIAVCGICPSPCQELVVIGTILSEIQKSSSNIAAKRRGSGQTQAVIRTRKSPMQITVDGEVMKTDGDGAWTRIGNPIITLVKGEGKTTNITTSGEWRNGSRHAHWVGSFTLALADSSGRSVHFFLLQENKRTGRGSQPNSSEYQLMNWESISAVPDDFWQWITLPDVSASINSTYHRQN